MTFAEIARVMKITEYEVVKLYHSGMHKLQEQPEALRELQELALALQQERNRKTVSPLVGRYQHHASNEDAMPEPRFKEPDVDHKNPLVRKQCRCGIIFETHLSQKRFCSTRCQTAENNMLWKQRKKVSGLRVSGNGRSQGARGLENSVHEPGRVNAQRDVDLHQHKPGLGGVGEVPDPGVDLDDGA